MANNKAGGSNPKVQQQQNSKKQQKPQQPKQPQLTARQLTLIELGSQYESILNTYNEACKAQSEFEWNVWDAQEAKRIERENNRREFFLRNRVRFALGSVLAIVMSLAYLT